MSVSRVIKRLIKTTPLYGYLKNSSLYKRYAYIQFKKEWYGLLLEEAEEEFKKSSIKHGSLKDYTRAFEKSLVSFSEYMYQYEFWTLTDEQREEYVSRLEMRLWYERHKSMKVYNLFWNKINWLRYFDEFIHRKWLDVANKNYDEFITFLNPEKEYIVKPIEGSLGVGIYKIDGKDASVELYNKLCQDHYLIEELLENETTLKEFHPFSLNTIRVVTLNNGEIVGTFVRFGNNGNVVDNAHAGGIFARINPQTGIVDTDGIDTSGHLYEYHPYSHKKIRGFVIPRWDEIRHTLAKMHTLVPDAPIVGWDVCITKSGQIEIIEGNHLPDVDVLQSPAKEGIRKQLSKQLKTAGLPPLTK